MKRADQAEPLRLALERRLGQALQLQLGHSRSQPVQARWTAGQLRLRLHRLFCDAPPEILDHLCRWLQVGRRARRACAALDTWIQAQVDALPPRGTGPLRPRGRHHDLSLLWTMLLRELPAAVPDGPNPALTFGRRGRSRAVQSLQLGSYHPERQLIRLHPCLDHPSVPDWFLRFVLYHELLHARIGEEHDSAGRILRHGPRFRQLERAHPDYARARAFEKSQLDSLLRRARSGT